MYLNMNCGTAGMACSCNSLRYKYESCGHVVTGDLSIIKDSKFRNLISKALFIENRTILIGG